MQYLCVFVVYATVSFFIHNCFVLQTFLKQFVAIAICMPLNAEQFGAINLFYWKKEAKYICDVSLCSALRLKIITQLFQRLLSSECESFLLNEKSWFAWCVLLKGFLWIQCNCNQASDRCAKSINWLKFNSQGKTEYRLQQKKPTAATSSYFCFALRFFFVCLLFAP